MLMKPIDWRKIKILAWSQVCADTFRLCKSVEICELDGRKVTYSFEPVDPPLPAQLLGNPDWEMFEEVLETAKVGTSKNIPKGQNMDDLEIELAMQVVNAYRFILEGRVDTFIADLNRLLIEK